MLGRLGPWELVLILAVVLMIFGPRRLPDLARSLGSSLREFRSSTRTDDPSATGDTPSA